MLAVFLPGFGAFERLFAPKSELWARWAEHDASSVVAVDHSLWNKVLAARLKAAPGDSSEMDYAGFNSDDRSKLKTYLSDLQATDVSKLNRDEQLAFWINLYNAATVQLVLDHYPVESIRDIKISPGLFSSGPWGAKILIVEGEELSLNDIEHRIIRPIWNEPRVHYALNCAAKGCPKLSARAFEAGDLDRMFEQAAAAYVRSANGIKSLPDGQVSLSKIYNWFSDDFGGEAAVLQHISQYAVGDIAAALAGGATVGAYHYDWSLNAPGGG